MASLYHYLRSRQLVSPLEQSVWFGQRLFGLAGRRGRTVVSGKLEDSRGNSKTGVPRPYRSGVAFSASDQGVFA